MPIRLTPAVKALLIACFAGFVIQHTADQFFGTHLLSIFGLVPSAFILNFHIWQIVTYVFLHGDVMHLFLNLMMIAFIGGELEGAWGTKRFVRFFFFCTTMGGLLYLFLQIFLWKGDALHVPMVGASGGIYGLLMAYGLIFGERVLLFMLLFPMKAKYFVWILAGVELMSTVFSGGNKLSGIAHLGGMAAGFGYLWGRATYAVWKRRRLEAPAGRFSKPAKKKKIQPQHLKLVINNKNRVQLESTEDDSDDKPPTFH
jgi:membrane associated rhomboid family serine protease